jgi:hypothetical protein
VRMRAEWEKGCERIVSNGGWWGAVYA